jgi:hypothetical protein
MPTALIWYLAAMAGSRAKSRKFKEGGEARLSTCWPRPPLGRPAPAASCPASPPTARPLDPAVLPAPRRPPTPSPRSTEAPRRVRPVSGAQPPWAKRDGLRQVGDLRLQTPESSVQSHALPHTAECSPRWQARTQRARRGSGGGWHNDRSADQHARHLALRVQNQARAGKEHLRRRRRPPECCCATSSAACPCRRAAESPREPAQCRGVRFVQVPCVASS